MAVQDYLTLSHLRKVVAAITQRIVGVENSVSNVENDVSEINDAIEELRNDKEVFIITMSYAFVGNYTLSATYEEIATAIRNGKTCCVTATLSGGSLYYIGKGSISEIFFENVDYLLAVNTNDTVTVVSRHIWIDNNSNKWVIAPFENFNLLSDVYCNLNASIYNPTIEDYDYSNIQILTERRKKYIYYIDPKTGDTVIFTNTDSSVNEWTRTIKPGSYSISRSSDTLTLTGSDGSTSTATLPSKTSDLTNDNGFMTGMTILSYGISTWADFIDAYTNKRVVYCRASSAANPATGSQTRLAFMAYVNDAENPTEVEFQYYRSISSHSNNQQGDQVYVYKLNKTGGWSVTVKECYTKVVAGTGLTGNWASGAITLSLSSSIPVGSTATPQPLGIASAGSSSDFSKADHVHALPTLSISSNVITLTGASGQTTSITLPVYNGGVSL